jgi:hypothetical protein
VILVDGVVESTTLRSEIKLITFAVAPSASQTPPASPIVSRNGVNTVVDTSYVRSHFARYVAFPSNAGSGQFGGVRVNVTIGADGTVQDVSCGPRASAVGIRCDVVAATIKQWAFSPFVVNGKAAPVVAHFTILSTASAVFSMPGPGSSSQ